MQAVPYEAGHLEELLPELREKDLQQIRPNGGISGLKEVMAHMQKYAVMNTFISNGRVVAIFVLLRQWDGVAEMWALTGSEVDKRPIAFVKACKRGLLAIDAKLELHRLWATVRIDYPNSQAWLKLLGFQPEGVLHKYGMDKADHILFARVR